MVESAFRVPRSRPQAASKSASQFRLTFWPSSYDPRFSSRYQIEKNISGNAAREWAHNFKAVLSAVVKLARGTIFAHVIARVNRNTFQDTPQRGMRKETPNTWYRLMVPPQIFPTISPNPNPKG